MIKNFTFALFALTAINIQAQEKALLDTLVQKGYLSNQEASIVARENVVVVPGSSETKSIRLTGGISSWYNWGNTNRSTGASPSETNSFTMRYVKFGIEADVGGGWDVKFITDFGAEGADRNYIDTITISKNLDLGYTKGNVDFGFKKLSFGLEQIRGDFEQYAIERSVATWFFTRPSITASGARTNFGSRATGIFFNGDVDGLQGLYYGLSLTGGATEDVSLNNNTSDLNKLSFFFNTGFKKDFIEEDKISYDFGLNYGYASGGSVSATGSSTIWGINPYVKLKWDNLNVIAEYFFQNISNATTSGNGASPHGANLIFSWRENLGEWGTIEPIFRYSYLDTNGATFNTNYGIDYFDKDGNISSGLNFNIANSVYFGANWYVVPAVKISLGYEFSVYDNLENNTDSNKGDATENSIKAQLQVIF